MKNSMVLLILIFSVVMSSAQRSQLDLGEAYDLLAEQYPSLKNSKVLEELYQHQLESIDKGRLPDIYLKGDSRLQSENLTIMGEPGAPVPFEFELPLFSAKGYVEVQYNILNGKIYDTKQALESTDLQKNLQEIEVERFALRNRINSLFVNITLLREREALIDLSIKDLETRLEVVQAGIDNGVTLSSEADKVRVKILELEASRTDLHARTIGMIKTLEQMTGTDLSDDVVLQFPDLGPATEIPRISRPEQELFKLQRESLLARSDLIDLDRRPYLGVFAQGGAGYPNPVNFFDTGFAPYGIVGINFIWKITDWNRGKLEKELLTLQADQVRNAEETFEFNLETMEEKYLSEVDRLEGLIETDVAIASLQADILDQMAAQLDEGVITSAEYITQVNAELKARQEQVVHQMQLLQAQLEFFNSRGTY